MMQEFDIHSIPMLSVIIPAYNCVAFLEQSVHSVLSQPCKNICVILVDDGSTDGTGEVADRLQIKYGGG